MGVHKRLACSEMVACQLSQRAPSNEEYVARARKLFAASKGRKVLFLATDDSQAGMRWIASSFDISVDNFFLLLLLKIARVYSSQHC